MKTQIITLTGDPGVTLTTYILDVSSEMQNAASRPAVLIFPGGGYYMCSDREAEPIAMAYLSEGYHAFVLRYSIGDRAAFPRPLQDAEAALTYIRDHAEEFGVIQDKIAVVGFSAGGHLAAALGTMGGIRPNALILGYPCILDTLGDVLSHPVPSCDRFVDSRTPPAFIFSTSDDSVVPIENSIVFIAALRKAGVPFEVHIFQNGSHGLSLANKVTSSGNKWMDNPSVAKWFDLSVQWLNQLFASQT